MFSIESVTNHFIKAGIQFVYILFIRQIIEVMLKF